MTYDPIAIADLSPAHLADLRQLAANQNYRLPPQRRLLFLRLQLILPCESLPTPSDEPRRRKPARPYVLTDLGRKLVTP